MMMVMVTIFLMTMLMMEMVCVLQEEAAVCLQEKLKKTSLTVASLEAALNIKVAETREMEAKNTGDSRMSIGLVLLYGVTRCD